MGITLLRKCSLAVRILTVRNYHPQMPLTVASAWVTSPAPYTDFMVQTMKSTKNHSDETCVSSSNTSTERAVA